MIIDVSVHNGTVDWEQVEPYIEGAILRCGYGNNIARQDDKQFIRNANECTRLKIPFGTYIYSYASNADEAKSEAEHVLRMIKGYELSLPIFFDAEEAKLSTVSAETFNTFQKAIREAGYKCGLYASKYFFNKYMSQCKPDYLWIAKYGTNNGLEQSKPDVGVKYHLWQYTSKGKMLGINSSGLDCSKIIDYSIINNGKQETETETYKLTATLDVTKEDLENALKYGKTIKLTGGALDVSQQYRGD